MDSRVKRARPGSRTNRLHHDCERHHDYNEPGDYIDELVVALECLLEELRSALCKEARLPAVKSRVSTKMTTERTQKRRDAAAYSALSLTRPRYHLALSSIKGEAWPRAGTRLNPYHGRSGAPTTAFRSRRRKNKGQ